MAPASLLSRLYQDLAEFESPYPGVALFIEDANIRQFCLVLTPPSGPWKNLSLHFDVVLPDNWPASPPKVSSSTHGIDHPNLFGGYICCDLLKERYEIYRTAGYTGGYTPALTLRGLFLQFLTFFSSSKVEQEYGGYVDIGEAVIVRYERRASAVRSPAVAAPAPDRPLPYIRGCVTCKSHGSFGHSSHYPSQDSLRQQWEEDTKPVHVLSRQISEVGTLTEATKWSGLVRIEEKNPRWDAAMASIRGFQCRRCPYGSAVGSYYDGVVAEAVPADQPSSALLTPPAACKLDMLNEDVLYTLASRLPSESIISFSAAYPRFHDVVQSMHILLSRELRCFFLRTPLSESILGIGVALDPRSRTLSSDFDWLSQRAFAQFQVRSSVEKRDFTLFLPLAFSRPHFERAYPDIWHRLGEIDKELHAADNKMSRNPKRRPAGPPPRQELVGVIYRMMNNIVVSLMKSCDTALATPGSSKTLLHASEKAVVAYCHLFHLLICLCRTDPQILRDATSRLRRFIARKDARVKASVPDLGELIVLIMLVLCRPPVGGGPPITWSNLAGPFLEEVIIRNVRWVLKDSPHLEVMEHGASVYRLVETFRRSQTSLRLVMFQITFLDIFFKAYGSNIARLDNNYGFPDKELPERMVEEVKAIYKINTWPGFFTRVRFAKGVGYGKDRFSDMLRDAVKTSAARRYHNMSPVIRLSQLRSQRGAVEAEALRS
ncbi:hypothetical protein DFH06DRAFT_666711 [Mycena polygramma]|nr:hypothetical protein DFH06DRAFT_666711 [Mycena polygramma]